MTKPAFLSAERVSRFLVAFLLAIGVLLPMLVLFELGAQIPIALPGALVLLALLTLQGSGQPWKWAVPAVFGIALLAQLFLPRMGVLGGSVEAGKAILLYMNNLHVVMPLFGSQVALLLTLIVSLCAYLFSKKGVGFLPAAIMVVMMLFALWSMGEGRLIWYTLPALCALLLLISQSAHEKMSVLNVLPMAVAVVVLSLLLLPGGRVTVAPMEKAAFALKQAITDYLFFTEPRNVFTLARYGYYPEGGNQLGGEAEPNDMPVMVVKTDRKTLMRGVVKDEYTGLSFRDTSSAKRYLYINPRWSPLRGKVFMESLPPEGIRKASSLLEEKALVVQVQNPAASTVFTPLYLRDVNPLTNMVFYFNDSSELFITRDMESGDRYTVHAPVFEGGDAGLGALVNAATGNDAYYQEIFPVYTRLPGHLEQKVHDDAASMTRDAQTPYDKATAIMRHLQKYYRYTLTPQKPPDNLDFVTYFLYVSKEGHCTYYASAMTVLCRMAGLPARYVEGFLATPAADGLAYVTGKQAHAWTEVYFEGFGWVPFDPTPSQQGLDQTPPDQGQTPDEPEPTPTPPPQEEEPPPEEPPPEDPPPEDDSSEDQPPENDPPPPEEPPFPWLLLIALAAITGGLIFQVRRRLPSAVAAKQETARDKIFVYGNAVNMILHFRKRWPKPGETPLAFARRMDHVHTFVTPIAPLWRSMAMSNYSGRQPGEEHTAKAQQTFAKIYKALPLLTRLQFWFGIAFNPKCYHSLDTVLVREAVTVKTRLPEPKSVKKGKLPAKLLPSASKTAKKPAPQPPAAPEKAPKGRHRPGKGKRG